MTPLENKHIVFIPSGRLGNAFFRYMACAIINIHNPTMTYILKKDFPVSSSSDTEYDYYAGLDYEGNDTYKNDSSAVGYNTLGFYKHTIDLENLTSNLYINKTNGHGLYVKKNLTLSDETFLKQYHKKMKYFNVFVDGFFHYDHIYLKYKTQLLHYMKEHQEAHYIQTDNNQFFLIRELLEELPLPNEKIYDIVIHLRLSDFKGRQDFIEVEYYLKLFETLDFNGKKICLLYEPLQNKEDILFIDEIKDWFQKNCTEPLYCESNSLMVDFNIMKQCKTLICSMSTLAWSAAYLSQQLQHCYMPNYNFYTIPYRKYGFFHKPIENTTFYEVKTTPPNISNISPYIITLPEYKGRLEKLADLRQNLSTLGLDPHIFYGVNGHHIDINVNTSPNVITYKNDSSSTCDIYTYDETIRINGLKMSRGEFGCALSHLNLIKKLASSPQEANYYLILEDDVELVKPLDELYNLLQHIPEDADMCHVARSTWYPFIIKKQVNLYFYECEKRYFNNATAYLISNKGAKKIMDYINNSINVPIDDLFNMMYRLTPDFRFYVPSDYFFKEQANVLSTIQDINK